MNLKDNAIPPRFENARDRLTYLLAEYKVGVMLAVGAVFVLIVSGRWEIPELPRGVREFLKAFAIGIVPAMFVTKLTIVDKFIPDPRVKVIEWCPDEDGKTIAVRPFKVPEDLWQDRKHEKGLPVLEPDGEVDAVVTSYEYDESLGIVKVRGASEDVADPASLMATNGKLDEIFNDLLDSKRELDEMHATLNLKQHEVERHVVNSLIAAVEHGVAFDGASEIIADDVWSEFDQKTRSDAQDDPKDRDHDRGEVIDQTPHRNGTAADGGTRR